MSFTPNRRTCQYCSYIYAFINDEDARGCPDCRGKTPRELKRIEQMRRQSQLQFADAELPYIAPVKNTDAS